MSRLWKAVHSWAIAFGERFTRQQATSAIPHDVDPAPGWVESALEKATKLGSSVWQILIEVFDQTSSNNSDQDDLEAENETNVDMLHGKRQMRLLLQTTRSSDPGCRQPQTPKLSKEFLTLSYTMLFRKDRGEDERCRRGDETY